jgi:predicted  nucleic acid-binding Zn-ribbon protein
MNPDLEKLVQLQKADAELRRVETALQEVPRRRAEAESRLKQERAHLDQAREALQESQKARRQHEGGLQDLETKRSKYKGQLMEVKTNKEYTAMLHEIENVEREIKAREDQILLEMERAESLGADVKREEAVFKTSEERHRGEARTLDEQQQALEAERERLRKDRDAVATGLGPDLLELYGRVARLRGSAVAEARDEMCQVCHVKLRPQMYVDLKRNEDIVQCPACNRILYFEPPVPVALQHP